MSKFVIRYLCDAGIKRILADFPGRETIAEYEARLYIKENTKDFDLDVFAIEKLPKCQNNCSSPQNKSQRNMSFMTLQQKGKLLAAWRWFVTRSRQKLK